MKKLNKRLLAFTLALVMAITVLPVSGFESLAEEKEDSDQNGTLIVTEIPDDAGQFDGNDGKSQDGTNLTVIEGETASEVEEELPENIETPKTEEGLPGNIAAPGLEDGLSGNSALPGLEDGLSGNRALPGTEDNAANGTNAGGDVMETVGGEMEQPSEPEKNSEDDPDAEISENRSFTVHIAWEDEDDMAGVRPKAVTLQLYADDIPVGDAVEIDGEDQWQHTWDGLDAEDENGKNIVWRAAYTQGQEFLDYYICYTDKEDAGVTITNALQPLMSTFSMLPESELWTVSLEWSVGEGIAEEKRTEAEEILKLCKADSVQIKVRETESGALKQITISGDSSESLWEAESDLESVYSAAVNEKTLTNANGMLRYSPEFITSVSVDVDERRIAVQCALQSYLQDADLIDIGANIVWRCAIDEDTVVGVKLLRNGEVIARENLSGPMEGTGSWGYVWTDMPKYDPDSGAAYEYLVEQELPEKYTGYEADTTFDSEGNITFLFYNNAANAARSLFIYFNWENKHEPESVPVTVLADGEVCAQYTLTKEGGNLTDEIGNHNGQQHRSDFWKSYVSWSFTISGLPTMNAEGRAIAYTVSVGDFEGKDSLTETVEIGSNSYTFKYASDMLDLHIQKVWKDDGSNESIALRPSYLPVIVYADGDYLQTVVLTAAGNWECTLEDFPRFHEDSSEIVYSVEEQNYANQERYQTTAASDVFYGVNYFTMTSMVVEREPVEARVSLYLYNLNEDNYNLCRSYMELELYADGELMDTIAVEAGENRAYSVAEKAVGNIVYTFFAGSYDSSRGRYNYPYLKIAGLPATNRSGEKMNYEVRHKLPDTLGVTSYESEYTGSDYTRQLSYSFTYYDTAVAPAINYNATTAVYFYNVWKDVEETELPEFCTVYLYADGKLVDRVSLPTAQEDTGTQKHLMSNYQSWFPASFQQALVPVCQMKSNYCRWLYLPKYHEDGTEISYEVQAEKIDGLFESFQRGSCLSGPEFTRTNQKEEPAAVSASVKMNWIGDEGKEDRPECVWVTLTANGKDTGQSVALSEENQWSYVWTNLNAIDETGSDVSYDVTLTGVPEAYKVGKARSTETDYILNCEWNGQSGLYVHWENNTSESWNNFMPTCLKVDLYDENGTRLQSVTATGALGVTEWKNSFAKIGRIAEAVLDEDSLNNGDSYYAKYGSYYCGMPVFSVRTVVDEQQDVHVYICLKEVDKFYSDSGFSIYADVSRNGNLESDNTENDPHYWDYVPYLYKNGVQVAVGSKSQTYNRKYESWYNRKWSLGYWSEYSWIDGRCVKNEYSVIYRNSLGEERYSSYYKKYGYIGYNNNTQNIRMIYFYPDVTFSGTYWFRLRLCTFTDLRGMTIPITMYWGQYEYAEIAVTVSEEGEMTATVTYKEDGAQTRTELGTYTNTGTDGSGVYVKDTNIILDKSHMSYKAGFSQENTWIPVIGDFAGKENMDISVADFNGSYGGNIKINERVTDKLCLAGKQGKMSLVKTWDDGLNDEGKRASTITYRIYERDDLVDTLQMSVSRNRRGNGLYSSSSSTSYITLPLWDQDGEPIPYTIVEEDVEEYTIRNQTLIIDDCKTAEDLRGTCSQYSSQSIYQDCEDSAEKCRVIVKLYNRSVWCPEVGEGWLLKNGERYVRLFPRTSLETETIDGAEYVYASASSVTISGLPIRDSEGSFIQYDVEYAAGGDLKQEVTKNYSYSSSDGIPVHTFSFTYPQSTTGIYCEKVWMDDGDGAGARPDLTTIVLYANGVAIDEAPVRTAGGIDSFNYYYPENVVGPKVDITDAFIERFGDYSAGFFVTRQTAYNACMWSMLPKYDGNGNSIVYEVAEKPVEGYQSKYMISNSHNCFTLTSQYVPNNRNVKVIKEWDDQDDVRAVRPDSVTIKLLDGNVEVDSQELNDGNGWAYEWENLPVTRNGKECKYSVREVPVKNYYGIVTEQDDGTFKITNHYTPTTFVGVAKIWKDDHNQAQRRPSSVTIQLCADGEPYGDPVILNAQNSWFYYWNDLPKENGITDIVYTAVETEVDDYSGSVRDIAPNGIIEITNTFDPRVDVTVEKIWEDGEDADGIRPKSIQVQLYADGEESGAAVMLNDEGGWKYQWSDLPEMKDGKEIIYSVQETEVPEGYVGSQKTLENGTIQIVNKHVPEVHEDDPETPDKPADPNDPQDPENPEIPTNSEEPNESDNSGTPDASNHIEDLPDSAPAIVPASEHDLPNNKTAEMPQGAEAGNGAQTGDKSPIASMAALLLIAAAALTAVMVRKRRRR